MKKLIVLFFAFLLASLAAMGQTTPPAQTAPPIAWVATTTTVFDGFTKQQIRDLEAFGFLASQYIKTTGRAADLAPFWGIQSSNIYFCSGNKGAKIWPKAEDAEKWQEYLKSQNIPEPDKKIPNQILMCFSDDEAPSFFADVFAKPGSGTPAGILFVSFARGFYSAEMVKNIPHSMFETITSKDADLLESWKNDAGINGADWRKSLKNKKIEFELVGRIMLMARVFYRVNFLLENDNFSKLEHCFLGNVSQKEGAESAEVFWNYEFNSAKILYEVSLGLAKDKKTGLPMVLPSEMMKFFQEEPDVDLAIKKHLKYILPKWYPDQIKLMGQFWEKK